MGKVLSTKERFEKYFMPEPNTGCWLWIGSLTSTGYGQLGLGSKIDGTRRPHKAHRVAYELYVGKIPPGMGVLHRCDNPPCVNPQHLFLGTQKDNAQDMGRKGRSALQRHPEIIRGESNPRAVLAEADAREIKRLKGEGLGPKDIALRVGQTYSAVCGVYYGSSWSHILPNE
jgi:hypothetical protein